ncbi:MAG: hypothetical protein WCC10_14280, partial [Tumebacillaceae bacterium]
HRPTEYVLIDQITLEARQAYEATYEALDPAQPVTMTLVWDDVPAEIGAERALVNRLSLEVEVAERVYRGNVFANGLSIPNMKQDEVNNVLKVILPAETCRQGTIRISPAELRAKARQDLAVVNQDFSLVIHNARLISVPAGTEPIAVEQAALLYVERGSQA